MNAQLIEAEDGEQIVVFPAGFEMEAEDVQLTKDGDRVVISPIDATAPANLES